MRKRISGACVCAALCAFALLTAACGDVNFNIEFMVDGEVYETVETSGTETVQVPANPSKTGFVFEGWFWDENTWERPFTANSFLDEPISESMRVYAKFAAAVCKVTFRAEGSQDQVREIAYGGTLTEIPQPPARPGFDVVWDKTDFSSLKGDLLVTAVYTPKTYRVSVDGEEKLQAFGSEVTITAPEKADMRFIKWTLTGLAAAESKDASYTFTMPANDVTASAVYESLKVTVTFDSQGGSSVSSQMIDRGGKAVRPADPGKANYVFLGWYTSLSFTTKYDFDSPVNGDITLYAKFSDLFIVTFDSNGGSPVESQEVASGGFLDKPADPTRTGYTFGGWYVGDTGDEDMKWNFAKEPFFRSETLIAKWTANRYTLAFDNNGGTGRPPAASEVVFDTAYSLPDCGSVKPGYHFTGWSLSADGTVLAEGAMVKTASDHTLYAIWAANTYTLRFDSTGGSAVSDKQVTFDTAVGELSDPERTGYGFDGWFLGEERYTAETVYRLPEDGTLTARWTPVLYHIVYVGAAEGEDANPLTYTVESGEIVFADIGKEGYTFGGFFAEADFETPVTSLPAGSTGDKTLYAKFSPVEYRITYENLYDADNSANPETYNIETAVTFGVPVRMHYDFAGFYTDAGLTVEAVIPEGSTGPVTVYAKWTLTRYTVSYVGLPESDETNPRAFTVEDGSFSLHEVSKEGYTFEGFYSDADYTDRIYAVLNCSEGGNRTVYVKFAPVVYSIAYIDDAYLIDFSGCPGTYTIEDEINFPAASHEGYDFLGYRVYRRAGLEDALIASDWTAVPVGTTGNLVVRTEWKAHEYTLRVLDPNGDLLYEGKTEYQQHIRLWDLRGQFDLRFGESVNYFYEDPDCARQIETDYRTSGDRTVYGKIEYSYVVRAFVDGGSRDFSRMNPDKLEYFFSSDQKYQKEYLWYRDEAMTQPMGMDERVTDSIYLYGAPKPRFDVTVVADGGEKRISTCEGYTLREVLSDYWGYAWYLDEGMTRFADLDASVTESMTVCGRKAETATLYIYNMGSYDVPAGTTAGVLRQNFGLEDLSLYTDEARTTPLADDFVIQNYVTVYCNLTLTLRYEDGRSETAVVRPGEIVDPWDTNTMAQLKTHDFYYDAGRTLLYDWNKDQIKSDTEFWLTERVFVLRYTENGEPVERRFKPEWRRYGWDLSDATGYAPAAVFKDEAMTERYSEETQFRAGRTLYLQYYQNTFTIRFDTQTGETLSDASADWNNAVSAGSLPVPAAVAGKRFAGWQYLPLPGTIYRNFYELSMLRYDLTLTALWVDEQDHSAASYLGKWTLLDGDSIGQTYLVLQADGTSIWYRSQAALNIFRQSAYMVESREGKEFLVGSFGEIELNAQGVPSGYQPCRESLVFIRHAENNRMNVATLRRGTLLRESNYEGYYWDEAFTRPFDHGVPVTESLVMLYARMEFTLSFVADGEEILSVKRYESVTGPEIQALLSDYGQYRWYDENFEHRVYFRKEDNWGGSQTFYGRIPQEEITVQLNLPSGGTCSVSEILYRRADQLTGALPLPVKDGWLFVGWNSKQDGSGRYYDDLSALDELDLNTTLYAVFLEAQDHTGAAYLGKWRSYSNDQGYILFADGTYRSNTGETGHYFVQADYWGDQSITNGREKLFDLTQDGLPQYMNVVPENEFFVTYLRWDAENGIWRTHSFMIDNQMPGGYSGFVTYTDPDFTQAYVYEEGVLDHDIILYLRREYVYTFDTDGGSEIAPFVFYEENPYEAWEAFCANLVANPPVKEGYVFIGWSRRDDDRIYASPRDWGYSSSVYNDIYHAHWVEALNLEGEAILGSYFGTLDQGEMGTAEVSLTIRADGSFEMVTKVGDQSSTQTGWMEREVDSFRLRLPNVPSSLLTRVTLQPDGTLEMFRSYQGISATVTLRRTAGFAAGIY